MLTRVAALTILCLAIAMSIDLFVCWIERRPAPGRQVLLAIVLVALITGRIVARLVEGSL